MLRPPRPEHVYALLACLVLTACAGQAVTPAPDAGGGNDDDHSRDDAGVPEVPKPEAVRAEALNPQQIQLGWEMPTARSATGYTFEVLLDDEVAAVADGPPVIVSALASGVEYCFTVVAIRTGDLRRSAASDPACATTARPRQAPGAPFGLRGVATPRTVSLTWNDGSDDELGFDIERSDSETGGWEVVTSLPPGSRAHVDRMLPVDTSFFYRVYARNAVGWSLPTDTLAISTLRTVPTAPGPLRVGRFTANAVTVNWVDNSSNEEGFQILRGSSADALAVLTTRGAEIQAAALATEPSTRYFFAVRAYTNGGMSASSNVVEVTTPPAPIAPSNVTIALVPADGRAVRLTWRDNSVDETTFELLLGTRPGGAFQVAATVPAGTTSHVITGLVGGSPYYAKVRSRNANGFSAGILSSSGVSTPP